jgi:hypothetical protein
MAPVRIVLSLLLLVSAGCAAQRPSSGLAMPAQDEASAAGVLAVYLLAQGWTVRLAEPGLVEATRGEERVQLEPVLDPVGLDRVIVYRSWPRDPQVDDAALRAFAIELNDTLNVGQFRAEPGGLVLQSSLPFVEELDPRLLDAFLVHTADVRLAVSHVQGQRQLIAPVEHGGPSR